MKNEKGSAQVIIIAFAIVILFGVAIFGFVMYKAPPQSNTLKGDINRDGKIDAEDADLVRKASPCNHAFECWKKVVGKTKDGDNPIYASDLDLNHDDNVNELDISAMSSE